METAELAQVAAPPEQIKEEAEEQVEAVEVVMLPIMAVQEALAEIPLLLPSMLLKLRV